MKRDEWVLKRDMHETGLVLQLREELWTGEGWSTSARRSKSILCAIILRIKAILYKALLIIPCLASLIFCLKYF